MKLKTAEEVYESEGLETAAFTLDNSSTSIIIDMMTRMYTERHLAFIRETCSNAYDAHEAADTQDTPFELHLPTEFEPWTEIRDFGPGLSKEFMLTKYTSVGHSSKRNSNKQIGGFGIGRLTFLLVTRQAQITSYQNGRKYVFSVARNQRNEIEMQLQYEGDTDEPNGLKLYFPVEIQDFRKFYDATQRYFSNVDRTMPNMTGHDLTLTSTEYNIKTPEWGTRVGGDEGIFVLMGNIAYTVPKTVIDSNPELSKFRFLIDFNVNLFCEIGDLNPVPSRESLDFDSNSIKFLAARLKTVADTLGEEIKKSYVDIDNKWDAMSHYIKSAGEIYSGWGRNSQKEFYDRYAIWNGIELAKEEKHLKVLKPDNEELEGLVSDKTKKLNFAFHEVFKAGYGSNEQWGFRNAFSAYNRDTANISLRKKPILFFVDERTAWKVKISYYLDQLDLSSNRAEIYVLNTPEECKGLFPTYDGMPEFILVSSLPAPPRTYAVTAPVADLQKFYRLRDDKTARSIYRNKAEWTAKDVDVNKGGFYVELDNWYIKDSDILKKVEILRTRNLLPKNFTFYGVPRSYKGIYNKPNWHNAVTFVNTLLKRAYYTRPKLYSDIECIVEIHRELNSSRIFDILKQSDEGLLDKIPAYAKAKALLQETRPQRLHSSPLRGQQRVIETSLRIEISATDSQYYETLQELEQVSEKVPLIAALDSWRVRQDDKLKQSLSDYLEYTFIAKGETNDD